MTLEMNLSQTFDTRGISKHQVKIISSAYRIINSSSARIQTIFKLVLEDRHSLLVQVSVFGCGKGWQPLGRGACFPEVIVPAGETEASAQGPLCAGNGGGRLHPHLPTASSGPGKIRPLCGLLPSLGDSSFRCFPCLSLSTSFSPCQTV